MGAWYSLFLSLIFLLRLALQTRKEVKKSIKQTENTPFHVLSGNKPEGDIRGNQMNKFFHHFFDVNRAIALESERSVSLEEISKQ